MANQDDLQQTLNMGIEAARRGDKSAAQLLLRQVVEAQPDNELAWMWLASAVDNIAERRECLEQALRINPENSRAREALGRLGGAPPPRQARVPRRRPRQPSTESEESDGPSTLTILIGAVVILAVVTGLIFVVVLSQQPNPTRQELVAALSPTVPATLDPNSFTATPSPFMVIVTLDITLPATFTPTFTPTATETPLPSPTAIPLTDFRMLYTSLSPDNAAPDIFSALADGSQAALAGSDVREIAYDPSGQKVAFVRAVQTTGDEGDSAQQGEVVELFVAPADDLAAARQITEFGSIISGPTWAPNGIQLAFTSDFDGDEDIWTITDDGLNSRKLTENDSSDRDPAWSPDGDQIVFISDIESPGITKLFSMTSEGEDIRRLNDLSGNTYNPHWSHDGSRLVFVNDSTGDGDIYIADANGQQSLLLTADDGGAEDREPAFTPDGHWVGFASNRDGENFQLYLIDLRGDVLTRLTQSDRDEQNLDFRPELELRLR